MKEEFFSIQPPFGDPISLYKNVWEGGSSFESLSIVSGLYGDQVNGLYITSRLTQFLQAVTEGREADYRLAGTVQILPLVNFMAALEGSPIWSFDRVDIDLCFPGNREGELMERLCHAILKHTEDSTYGIILTTAGNHYEDHPHIQLHQEDRAIRNLARGTGIQVARKISRSPTLPLHLLSQWDDRGKKSLILTAGKTGVIDPNYCDKVFGSMLNLMLYTGLLTHTRNKGLKTETVFYDAADECSIRSEHAGLYLPEARVGDNLLKGDRIGLLRDIYTGEILEEFSAPQEGFLVRSRSFPVVYEREIIALLLPPKKKLKLWPF